MLTGGMAYSSIISGKDMANPALSLGKPLPALNPTSLQQNLNNREVTVDGFTATERIVTQAQTLVWNRPPGSNQTALCTSKFV